MKTPIVITIVELPGGKIAVRTNDAAPSIGRSLTPAQALAVDLLRVCKNQADEVAFQQEAGLHKIATRCLDPEDLGYAVSPHCRDDARELLGIPRVETVGRTL